MPLVDTTTISVGQVIDNKTVQDIPLKRSPFVDLVDQNGDFGSAPVAVGFEADFLTPPEQRVLFKASFHRRVLWPFVSSRSLILPGANLRLNGSVSLGVTGSHVQCFADLTCTSTPPPITTCSAEIRVDKAWSDGRIAAHIAQKGG